MGSSGLSDRSAHLRRPGFRTASGTMGFTLVELLVATAILTLILGLLFTVNSQIASIWKRSASEIEAFQEARAAYQTLTMRLSQATLNTYLDYYDADLKPRDPASGTNGGAFVPRYYARNSNLHFLVGDAGAFVPDNGQPHPGQAVFFQAPLGFTINPSAYAGLPTALNACGYFIEFNSDQNINQGGLPPFLGGIATVLPRWRYRLMEFLQPTESLSINSLPSSGSPADYCRWFTSFLPTSSKYSAATSTRTLRALADNIIALIILPMDQGSPILKDSYTYDSRSGNIFTPTHHQLPPVLRLVMIAVDERSAQRLNPADSSAVPAAITSALSGRFQNPASLDADITAVTARLAEARINYRVFDTNIAIRGAKWSDQ